jgi:L-iditol 2-dehydrogenase
MIGCARCDACRAGRTQICPGVTELGLTRDGGWCDRLTAPVANCHVVPDAVPTALAALVEPLSCQLGLVRAAGPGPEDHVLIVGSGVAALLYTHLCVVHGAGAVTVAVDDEARGDVARALGADHVIVAPDRPSSEAGYTKAIDAVGTAASLASCVDAVAPGGHVSLYGLGASQPAFPLHITIFKNLTLSAHTSAPWLWEEAIALVADGRAELEPLVTDRVGFGDVGEFLSEALQGALAGPRIKAVIDHGEPPKPAAVAMAPGFRSPA